MGNYQNFDLVKAALKAEGIHTKKACEYYSELVNSLVKEVSQLIGKTTGYQARAKELFNWLWSVKPLRYHRGGNFQLSQVLKAQTSPQSVKVGNCLGLTLLYNVVASRIGLKTGAGYLESAFNRGPHVFSLLYDDKKTIYVENTLSRGFDFQEYRGDSSMELWGNEQLVADIYHSTGNECFEQGELERAIKNYHKAIELNPSYGKPYLNLITSLEISSRQQEIPQVIQKYQEVFGR